MIKEGYTRVSEIIGWCRKQELGEIDPAVLKNKANLGSNVHDAIDAYFSGHYVPLTEKEQPYFDSFQEWISKCPNAKSSNPGRLYCDKLMITGEIDSLLQLSDAMSPIQIDFKTSAQPDLIGWQLQGAFYRYLLMEEVNKRIFLDDFLFLQLRKDGKIAKEHWFEYSPKLLEDAMTCLKAYRIWN